jgi:hypothetical protein
MLDRIEESEEEPEQPLREETPTPESSRLGVGGMRGATKVKATMKTQKSGTTKNAGQGPAEKRQRKAATATQGKRKVRDEDDEVPQASKKVKESAEGLTRKTRAQVGKQTAAPQTLPPPETPTRVTRARSAANTPTTHATPDTARRNPPRHTAGRALSPVPESPSRGSAKRKPRPRMVTKQNKPPPDGRDEWDLSGRRKRSRI